MNNITGIPTFPATSPGSIKETVPGSSEGSFGDTLKEAITQVDGLQTDANGLVANLLQGERQDLHNVMIAVEKADVAFQFMMQVRNKIVNAYQEISKLQF